MTPEIKILHQLSANQIFEAQLSTASDLKAWIANGDYLFEQKLTPYTSRRANEFTLNIRHEEMLYASLANDCNRFSQAAIESMWSISEINKIPKSTGWATVQMYYSSFFAAHAILRIFGRACTQLECEHINVLFKIATATNMAGNVSAIENGFYYSLIKNNSISFKKLKESHADTWASFSELLTWLIQNIHTTTGLTKHKFDATELISNIKSAIHSANASKGNWLSQMRNKVNYQHTHGVWHPYKGALHKYQSVIKNSEWTKDPSTFDLAIKNNEIQLVHNLSNAILSLMYHLIKHGFERSGKVNLALTNGTFRLINQLHVA